MAMLVEDTTAFIEELEVLKDHKRADKHRRRVAQAELDMLEAMREVQLAADALRQMELTLVREVESLPVKTVGELYRRPGARSLVREIGRVEAHLGAMRGRLTAKRRRLDHVEKSARESDATRRRATVFRLHSGQHHLDLSAARFKRLSAAQLEQPVLLARRRGQRWWWYLDRFWWPPAGLTATDIEGMVLQADLDRKRRSDAIAEARLILLGDTRVSLLQEHVSEAVRIAVWRRDRGRCVDCGSGKSVIFDHIVPTAAGGSDTALNVELRCHSCRVRLARNEMQTRVNRARAEVSPHYQDERVSA
jgi:hypothetical protein